MIGPKIGFGKLAIVFVVDFPAAVVPRPIVHEQIAFATAAVPRVATVVSTEPFSSMKKILSSSFFVFAVGINGGSVDIVVAVVSWCKKYPTVPLAIKDRSENDAGRTVG